MKKTLAIKLAILLAAAAASPALAHDSFRPPDDGKDWIQLTSGEWLRGELTGLFSDEVEFDSDVLEELTIDWEDIAQIVSSRAFGVSFQSRQPLTGRLRFDGERVIVAAGDEEYDFARDDVVGISAKAERERDRWSADVSLGLTIRKGNSDIVEYSTIAGFERRTPLSRSTIDYVGSFNETEGVRVADNHRITGVVNRFTGSRLFWRPADVQYYRDEFQNIAHQGTVAAGLGYELRDTTKTHWVAYGSAGYNYLQRVSVEPGEPKSTTSPSLTLGTDFETDLTSWIEYEFSYQVSFLDEESGERQHHLVTTISTDVFKALDFDVSLIWDRTDKPQPDAAGVIPEKDDFRLTVGLGIEF